MQSNWIVFPQKIVMQVWNNMRVNNVFFLVNNSKVSILKYWDVESAVLVILVFNFILAINISPFSSSESTAGDAGPSTASSSAPGKLYWGFFSRLIFLLYQSKLIHLTINRYYLQSCQVSTLTQRKTATFVCCLGTTTVTLWQKKGFRKRKRRKRDQRFWRRMMVLGRWVGELLNISSSYM